ncbi:hypothetical protein B9T62_34275 [Paenibacillus donghaensis]|uniref:Uncharacterized protein n=1 Tax=Paenibacillus donghaensis TaxID=414771 RepID=A0A2Z2KRC5_9BACL|nr:hypothetical protein B9T62_34275 [Paenibacillus donghaensis]
MQPALRQPSLQNTSSDEDTCENAGFLSIYAEISPMPANVQVFTADITLTDDYAPKGCIFAGI